MPTQKPTEVNVSLTGSSIHPDTEPFLAAVSGNTADDTTTPSMVAQAAKVIEDTDPKNPTEPEEYTKYGPGILNSFNTKLYKILNMEEYTIENMIFNNGVECKLQITPYIAATYRSLSTEELFELEKAAVASDEKSAIVSYNEINLRPTVKSLIQITTGDKTVDFGESGIDTDTAIRSMPAQIVNELMRGYTWFNQRTAILVRGSDLKN